MRFESPHNEAQEVISALHRVREGLVRNRTGTINRIHAFLLEFGISLPRGMAVIRRLPAVLAQESSPPRLVALLERLQAHFKYLDELPPAAPPFGEAGGVSLEDEVTTVDAASRY